MTDQPSIRPGQHVSYAEAPYEVIWSQGGLLGLRGLAYETGGRSYRARKHCTVLESDVTVVEMPESARTQARGEEGA